MAVNSAATGGGAADAALSFERHEYQDCVQALAALTVEAGKKPKLLHNQAIAEFYQGGGRDAPSLQEKLRACQAHCDDLAKAAEAELDGATSPSASSSSRGESFSADGGAKSGEPYSWDYNTAVLTFNRALLQYQQHRYSAAAELLEPLYTNLEPLDEAVALRVCLLLLDVHLKDQRPAKAANVLTFLEKLFSVYFPSAQLTAPGKEDRPRSSSESRDTKDRAGPAEDAAQQTRPAAPAQSAPEDSSPSRTASEEEDGLFTAAPSRGRGRESFAGFSKPLPIGADEFKLRLHLGRARLHMVTQNLKSMKRELKAALGLSKDHPQALTLKAQLECSRGNYKKAIKLLVTAHKPETPPADTPQSSRAAFLANLGTVHHFLNKHSLASLYFSKALEEVPLSLAERPQTDSRAVLYSAAVEQLVAEHPGAAIDCFRQTGRQDPLLWLRLGEASLAAHSKRGADASDNDGAFKRQVQVSVVGEGPWRRLLLLPQDRGQSSEKEDEGGSGEESMQRAGESKLLLAKKCFETVLASLSETRKAPQRPEVALRAHEGHTSSSQAAPSKLTNGSSSAVKSNGDTAKDGTAEAQRTTPTSNGSAARPRAPDGSVPPLLLGGVGQEKGLRPVVLSSSLKASIAAYDAEQKQRDALLWQAASLALAYVDLSLGNVEQALSSSEAVLKTPPLGRIAGLLARTYAAEALCWLGRPGEATDHLTVALTEQTAAASDPLPPVPEQGPVQDKEQAIAGAPGNSSDLQSHLTGPGARVALYVNLAAAYAMKGELAEAQRCFARASEIAPDSASVLLAGVYLDLQKGEQQEALVKLEACRQLWLDPHLIRQRT